MTHVQHAASPTDSGSRAPPMRALSIGVLNICVMYICIYYICISNCRVLQNRYGFLKKGFKNP